MKHRTVSKSISKKNTWRAYNSEELLDDSYIRLRVIFYCGSIPRAGQVNFTDRLSFVWFICGVFGVRDHDIYADSFALSITATN